MTASAGLALFASACAGEPPPVPCPQVAVLADAARQDVYLEGREGDPAARIWGISMGDVFGGCTYDDAGVTVEFTVDLFVQPGPVTPRPAVVSAAYGVAVIDPDGNRISGELVTPELGLGAEGTTWRQLLTQRIPGATPETGADYRILLGLPDDPEDVLPSR